MSETQINILVILIGIPFAGLGIYLWLKAVKHLWGMLNNFKPDMTWGRFLPFCIFMPMFFTNEGNKHRNAMLKYSGLFIVFGLTPFAIAGLLKMYLN